MTTDKNFSENFRNITNLYLSNNKISNAGLIHIKDLNQKANSLAYILREKGVGSQVHYIPIHLQPYYQDKYGYKKGDYPVSEDYYKEALAIPLYPGMSDDDVEKVTGSVKEILLTNE